MFFCHKCKSNQHRPFQLVFPEKLLTQIQWKSKIFSSAAGRKWTKGEMKIEELLVLVAPFLDDGSLNGHRIYSDRRIYSPPDWNLGGRGRFSVTKDGFETCKILKKTSAGLICFIARETAGRYWANQGQLYPTKVKYTPTFLTANVKHIIRDLVFGIFVFVNSVTVCFRIWLCSSFYSVSVCLWIWYLCIFVFGTVCLCIWCSVSLYLVSECLCIWYCVSLYLGICVRGGRRRWLSGADHSGHQNQHHPPRSMHPTYYSVLLLSSSTYN